MKFIKLIKDINSPTTAYKNDAGIDLYSPIDYNLIPRERKQIKLGLSIEIQEDEVAIISERSGMAIKYGITSIGNIIDSGYRGEISVILHNLGEHIFEIKKNDKIAQIVICKLGNRDIKEVKELSPSERDKKAHYSSNK